MTKDQGPRILKSKVMTNTTHRSFLIIRHSSFVIRHSSFPRQWSLLSLVTRHSSLFTHSQVLPRKDWKPELTLRLVVLLMAVLGLGGIVIQMVVPHVPSSPPSFTRLILTGLVFHGAAFPLIHWFVRKHNRTWREAFG